MKNAREPRWRGPLTSGFWERMDLPLDQMEQLADLFQGVIDETDEASHLGLGNFGDLLERLAGDMEAMGKRRRIERTRVALEGDVDAGEEPSLSVASVSALNPVLGGILMMIR